MSSRRELLVAGSSALAGMGTHALAQGQNATQARTSQPDAVAITDHGASTELSDNKVAIERAIRAAGQTSRVLWIPAGTFRFSNVDWPANDGADIRRFVLAGHGVLSCEQRGTAFTAGAGPFYDLVIDGPSFASVEGRGVALLDGDRFRRLVITPGTQIRNFDWVIRAREYLQSVRVIGAIIRGGSGAVVKAPAAFDCIFTHNIIEFVTDGIVIDGPNDPALNRCSIDDNLIEGIGGRAVVLGACIATSVSNNYLENNTGADIRLDGGTAPHKGLRVQGNAIQLSAKALAEGRFGITWGKSTALPARAGGNFCNGNLHDTAGSTALIDMNGDFAAAELYRGFNPRSGRNAPVGRAAFSDGLAQRVAWFDRSVTIDPHYCEIGFAGRFTDAGEVRVLTFGTGSPQQNAAAFDRKTWVRGSVVFNTSPKHEGIAAWVCLESGAPGVWGSIRLDR